MINFFKGQKRECELMRLEKLFDKFKAELICPYGSPCSDQEVTDALQIVDDCIVHTRFSQQCLGE